MKLFNKKFPNIYQKGRRLYTRNLTPGKKFFEEPIIKEKGNEYRRWDESRSKLAAAIMKKISQIGIQEGDFVLYLGASHGYTPSFMSDIVGKKGFIYALDFAPRVVKDLVFLCEERNNLAPIMADAARPDTFSARVSQVDIVYQDLAQKDQAGIFLKNCETFLKPGGFGLLTVKSRSIDISKSPKQVFQETRHKLEKDITIVDYRVLDPYEKDHAMIVVKKK